LGFGLGRGSHGRDARATIKFGPGEVGAAAVVVAVLEAGEFAAEFAEALPALIAIFHLGEGVEVGGEFSDGEAGEVFKKIAGFGLLEGSAGFGDALDVRYASLVFAPVLKAAEAPIGKVGSSDGFVVEFLGEEFAGFGERIQPFKKFGALFAVFKAMVEVIADGLG